MNYGSCHDLLQMTRNYCGSPENSQDFKRIIRELVTCGQLASWLHVDTQLTTQLAFQPALEVAHSTLAFFLSVAYLRRSERSVSRPYDVAVLQSASIKHLCDRRCDQRRLATQLFKPWNSNEFLGFVKIFISFNKILLGFHKEHRTSQDFLGLPRRSQEVLGSPRKSYFHGKPYENRSKH